MKNFKKIKYIILAILFLSWIIFLISAFFLWINLENFFQNLNLNKNEKTILILLFFTFRTYFLIPSTILILLAWYILQDFYLTLTISTIWVSIWIIQAYFIGKFLWEDIKNKKIIDYQKKIKENWFKFIFLFSLIPIFPLDLVYYAAASSNYDIRKYFLAGILWELPLIIIYSYLWKEAERYTHLIIWTFILIFLLFLIVKFAKNKKI